MPFLTWSNEYSVGVRAADNQHTNLFNILNDLHDAMKNGQGQKAASTLLRKLVDYTVSHFAAEEKLMESTGYPGLEVHRIQHKALTRQVGEFMARLEKGERAISLDLLDFLRDWLKNHIQGDDKAYGPWLNQRGVG